MSKNSKLIGHDIIFHNLINLYNNDLLPNKILFSGNNGIGKYLLAKHFINYIFSKKEDYKYDLNNLSIHSQNKSNILLNNKTHPNIFYISKKAEKKFIEISQIREMIQFQNRSSFNNQNRIILINDVEYLNSSSANALLKSVEEPNNNLFYILIYNSEKRIPHTLKSRCIEFKIILLSEHLSNIVNNYFDKNVYQKIPIDFLNIYSSPSFLISLINFMINNEINNKDATIENFILNIIHKKLYLKDPFIINNINYFIELFFYKNISLTKKITFKIKEYFYLKLSLINKYNLDLESFFLEFEEKLLSE